ncbi:MAG TPA: hypothetical protein VFP58_15230 [Candidatus Eisenbacteria bacterium]|nr:hypothetical protein [Candidatus Eisenbacteria bacterium]
METIREAMAVAEPESDVRAGANGPSSPSTTDPAASEGDLALQIRMTASSLAGIALIHRNPDIESSR